MAELLVKAKDAVHGNPVVDRVGCYKRGMPVVVMPDNHVWGIEERLPIFVVIKIPLIPVAQVLQYIEAHEISGVTFRRRRWQIRWADLPLSAMNLLATNGELTIKATPVYAGNFDYTWTQIKGFFRNLETNLDETREIV